MSPAVPLTIPRWQWRTVAADLAGLFSRFPEDLLGPEERADETHVLSPHSSHSVVLTGDRLVVSWRKETAPEGLERWDSILDLSLPFRANDLDRLWAAWGVPRPPLPVTYHSDGDFLSVAIAANGIPFVLTRRRRSALVDGILCSLEVIDIAPSTRLYSLAIEHEDPSLILGLLADLGLEPSDNINLVQGLRSALGLKASDAGKARWQKKSNESFL